MAFLELTIPCSLQQFEQFEEALEAAGALSVTMSDAHLDAADEQAIFEPGVGETPLWNEMTLNALFDGARTPEDVLAALAAADSSVDWAAGSSFKVVEDQDWERAWMDQYEPLKFGLNTWIVPWNSELPAEASVPTAAVVRLDPGLAFGSGTHPTTALCLEWLDTLASARALQGERVLDFGCGSGILAIAAIKLGAAHAVGVDNDPQAIIATRDNAERNEIAEFVEVFLPDEEPAQEYPVVVANILASALIELAPTIISRVEHGGVLAMSGILAGQEDEVMAAYSAEFKDLKATQQGDWMRVTGTRR